ncbi:MAG TPA: universal stress protein [Dissulfurispiraceae bacterium]|nr:universal stress protein [Dissulfurispiraceae bacterium]
MSAEQTVCPLNRHVLIAADGSENSARAVAYMVCMLGNVSGVQVTLLNIISIPPEDYFLTPEEEAGWLEEHERSSKAALRRHTEQLVAGGISVSSIAPVVRKGRFHSIAETILDELRKSGAGTLVVGRRGISRKEEFIYGSTSSKLLHAVKNSAAMWVIE